MGKTYRSEKRTKMGCGSSCDYCLSNRTHKNDKRLSAAKADQREAEKNDA